MSNEDFMNESDGDFAQMLDAFDSNQKSSNGIVQATIISITKDTVFLDTNQKTEKRMPLHEIQDAQGDFLFKVGSDIEVVIENGKPSYKKIIQRKKIDAFVQKIADNEVSSDISVKIVGKNKGGYVVAHEDMNFFMPRSLSFLKSDVDQIGKIIDVKIIKADESGVLVSRKHFLDTRNALIQEKALKLIESGEALNCRIEKVHNFGIFVSAQGIPSIIKYNELSYKGNINPHETYEENQELQAKPIAFDEDRRVLEFSLKALLPNPWDNIANLVKVGDVVKSTVANIQPYGAFVSLHNCDLDALLHISELSWTQKFKHPSDKVSVGQEIDLRIIEINKEKQQIKCSLKDLEEKPFSKFIEKYDVGDKVTGKVVHITEFGAFIHIEYIDGLLLNVNSSWSKGETCKDLFKIGDEVETTIESIDKSNDKVYLTRKTLLESPVTKFAQTHHVGDKIKGKLVGTKDFGIFINVDDLLDVFIPTANVAPLKVNELKIDDEIECTLVDINHSTGKVKASVKEVEIEPKINLKDYSDDGRTTLGDILRRKN